MRKQEQSKRLIAYVIDWYIVALLVQGPMLYISSIYLNEALSVVALARLPIYLAGICLMVSTLLVFIYLVVLPRKTGQTLGKKALSIKVVSDNLEPVTFMQLVKREFIGTILIEGGTYVLTSYYLEYFAMVTGIAIPYYLTWGLTGVVVVSAIMALVREDNKMIHDIIAKTKIIKI